MSMIYQLRHHHEKTNNTCFTRVKYKYVNLTMNENDIWTCPLTSYHSYIQITDHIHK